MVLKKLSELNDKALELMETFINGNRSDACSELRSLMPLEAAYVAAVMCNELSNEDRNSFISALEARL